MIKKKKILNKFSKFVHNDFKKYRIMENRKKIEKMKDRVIRNLGP